MDVYAYTPFVPLGPKNREYRYSSVGATSWSRYNTHIATSKSTV